MDYKKQIEELKKKDKILAKIIEKYEEFNLQPHKDYFKSLIESIVSQQLHWKAAETILQRLLSNFKDKNNPTPKELFEMSEEKLKQAGISPQKLRYLKDLSQKFLDKTITPEKFHSMNDEQIIEELTKIKGIGRWTAEMFLMFCLVRLDIMPFDDLGIKKGMQIAYKLKKHPEKEKMQIISNKWKPYRTIACWYLWDVVKDNGKRIKNKRLKEIE